MMRIGEGRVVGRRRRRVVDDGRKKRRTSVDGRVAWSRHSRRYRRRLHASSSSSDGRSISGRRRRGCERLQSSENLLESGDGRHRFLAGNPIEILGDDAA